MRPPPRKQAGLVGFPIAIRTRDFERLPRRKFATTAIKITVHATMRSKCRRSLARSKGSRRWARSDERDGHSNPLSASIRCRSLRPFSTTYHRAGAKPWRRLLASAGEAVVRSRLAPQGIYAKKELRSAADMKGLNGCSTRRCRKSAGGRAQSFTIQAAGLKALATGAVTRAFRRANRGRSRLGA